VQEDFAPFHQATADGVAAAAERHAYDGLDESLPPLTVEQMRRDLLEAREDVRAGRVYSVDDVLAAMDAAFEQGVVKRLGRSGDPFG
jgi:hypothetical protein